VKGMASAKVSIPWRCACSAAAVYGELGGVVGGYGGEDALGVTAEGVRAKAKGA